MIQEIYPHTFNNAYKNYTVDNDDTVFVFKDEKVLIRYEDNKIIFPLFKELNNIKECIYLFSIDDTRYFIDLNAQSYNDSFSFVPMKDTRTFNLETNTEIFAIYSAYHLWKWYCANKYCGACKEEMIHDSRERALRCPKCNNVVYPRINPAVIIGVTNKDKIILTRYRVGYKLNALVAGFTEFGETLEQTVEREVMEEVGLKVKNIRYYKSQPWGVAQDILAGFFCEVDGDDTIHVDETELKSALWVKREDIELQDNNYSLTNEMMRMFKENKI